MKTTKHAERRMQQRAISGEVTQRIVEEGSTVSAHGGALFYWVPDKLRKAKIEYHRHQLSLWEKAAGKTVLVAGEEIITVMPRYKKLFQE